MKKQGPGRCPGQLVKASTTSVFGGRSRTRTYDPLIKSQLLYQLSYAPEFTQDLTTRALS